MESRYNPKEADAYCARFTDVPRVLATRAYTAELMRQEATFVVHGGASSVKAEVKDAFGNTQHGLWIRDALDRPDEVTPDEFSLCSIEMLKRSIEAGEGGPVLTRRLRAALLESDHQPPSRDALVHAWLPGTFVDQCHTDTFLQIVAQEDPEQLVRQVFGDEVLYVPYAAGGVARCRAVIEAWNAWKEKRGTAPKGLVIGRQGLFTWGESAEESYGAMASFETAAAVAVAERLEPVSAAEYRGGEQDEARRLVALALRGALWRATRQRWVCAWGTTPELLRFTRRDDIAALADLGCALPDDAPHTRRVPLVLEDLGGGTAEALVGVTDTAVNDYASRYRAYLSAEQLSPHALALADRLDPWPRVALVTGLGVLGIGPTRRDAERSADLYERTVDIIDGANALGSYSPVGRDAMRVAELLAAEQLELGHAPGHHHGRGALPLAGQVVLVTGAASGIGVATSRAMLAAGAHVMICAKDGRVLDAVCEWPREQFPGRVAAIACDVARESDCIAAVQATCDAFGGIDVLVSNAGIAPSGGLHTDSGDAALRRSIDINLLGHQRVARAAAATMLAQGSGGALLFNASKSAFHQGPDFGPYAVPKAALIALMRQYAVDLGHAGIRTNAVNADRIRTQSRRNMEQAGLSPSAYFRSNLLGRETETEDVAEAFVYLATASATTGCVITVDGGNPAAFPR